MTRTHALPILSPTEAHHDAPTHERSWWRSLEELANTSEFQEYVHREFPDHASEWQTGSRRDFLRLMGASLLLAGASGCDIKPPQEKIVPAVGSARHAPTGLPLYFTTAMDFAGSAVGLTVQSRDGRPIKIEGNAHHPASLGATGVFAQAATLDLYDPDRLRAPTVAGKTVSLERVRSAIAALRAQLDENQGQGLRLLLGTSTSPTLARLLNRVTERWPQSKWCVYESINDDQSLAGRSLAYGKEALTCSPIFDFNQADILVSVDYDFLANRDTPPCYIRQFADARRIAGKTGDDSRPMVRLHHLGSTPTPTSAKADYSLAVLPSQIGPGLHDVAARLGIPIDASLAPSSERTRRWVKRVVTDLQNAGKRSAVVVGRDQPPAIHALAHAINEHTGATGHTVRFVESPQVRPPHSTSDAEMLADLSDEMQSGKVSELLILGGNPVFDGPGEFAFPDALTQVNFSLTLADASNETSMRTKWAVPQSHFLESWGDARAYNGVAGIIQPLIAPLYNSLSAVELLTMLCDDAASGYAAVRKTWEPQLGQSDDDARWQQAVSNGVIEATEHIEKSLQLDEDAAGKAVMSFASINKASSAGSEWEVVCRPDPTIWDGRFANNGWLQEMPKPLSQVVWDNTAWIAPTDAKRLNVENGDVIGIGSADRGTGVELPVWIVPGHAVGCLSVFTGLGRAEVGRVGKGTGFNAQSLRTTTASQTVTKTGRKHNVVTTQHHQVMEGRDLVRSGSLVDYLQQSERPGFAHPPTPTPDTSFFPDWSYQHANRWGMTIDLTACVGCSACVIACQAENNIPVVGKRQCSMNRHMHWIRVDTYFQGSPEQPEHTLSQPVPCMQCEQAPCELVCPVAATSHSDDGLNQMVYNRCVGTRYCSNNCPYKVRRFNFLDFSDRFITEPSLHLLSNPEVTIRERGVMEKCTYCVQRIEQARIGAQLDERPISDGDIKTACQAVCPAQAIRFGDLHDADSAVRATHDHPLNYVLLEELHTKPRTTYLAEVYHRNEGSDA